jgi:GNAT superfamily N-acetyltransferase
MDAIEPDFPRDYRYCTLTFAEQRVMLDDNEPSRYLMHWNGTIDWHPPRGERVDSIGAFSLYLVDCDSAINDRKSVFDVFDSAQQTMDLFEDLFDVDTDELKMRVAEIAFGTGYAISSNVLLFDRLVIYPAHRGRGVGLLALRALMHHFRSFAGIMVMKPFPLQFEGSAPTELSGLGRENWALENFKKKRPAATARLRRHYAKLGFAHVPRTDYMVRDPLEQLPEADDLLSKPTTPTPTKPSPRKSVAAAVAPAQPVANLDAYRQRRAKPGSADQQPPEL